jgi:hypothetical protein
MLTAVERDDPERDRRIDRLAEDLDLLGASTRACAEAGLPGREQAVAYCLVVLADKDARQDTERERTLDVNAPDAAERVAYWAATVARTMKHSQALHIAIQEEAKDYRYTKLQGLLKRSIPARQDDVLDAVGDWIIDVLRATRPIDEMTLDTARHQPPPGNAYVFRQPLTAWIGTVAKRKRPVGAGPLPPDGPPPRSDAPEPGDVVGKTILENNADALSLLTANITHLRTARTLMAEALGLTGQWKRTLDGMLPATDADERVLARVRNALTRVADLLALEARALTGMLAYVILAMRAAPGLQHVVVASLRLEAIDRGAIDDIAARMRALLDDPAHPHANLVRRTEMAPRPPVTGTRAKALDELTGAPTSRRRRALAPVARLLDTLPPTVPDVAAISQLTGSSLSLVGTYRNNASAELEAIDTDYSRVYRRYAMGPRA